MAKLIQQKSIASVSILFWVLPLAAAPVIPAQANPAPPICPAALSGAIDALVDQPQFQRGRWGIVVQTQAQPGSPPATLYQRDATKFFIPASNAKLITTAAALQQLGPQFQVQTQFYGEGNSPRLRRLVVVGRGDPSLSQAKLQAIASQLYQLGIRQIETLVGDDHYFGGESINPTWQQEDVQAGYGAPVNSLIVDQNAIDLTLTPQALGQPLKIEFADPNQASQWQIINQTRTVNSTEPEFVSLTRNDAQKQLLIYAQLQAGASPDTTSIAVPQPGQHFLLQLQQALRANQIQVGQVQLAPNSLANLGQPLATITSDPLPTLLAEVNQVSNNLYAEVLLRWLGLNSPAASSQVASAQLAPATAGLAALPQILAPLGVDRQGFSLIDGSGLSRRNLVSPLALVQVLQGMQQSPYANLFRNSLTVAGKTGTLKNRLVGTAAAGQLQGKTGTLTDAVSLSGYLRPAQFDPLVFSVMVNQTDQSASVLRRAIDEIVLVLTRLRQCS